MTPDRTESTAPTRAAVAAQLLAAEHLTDAERAAAAALAGLPRDLRRLAFIDADTLHSAAGRCPSFDALLLAAGRLRRAAAELRAVADPLDSSTRAICGNRRALAELLEEVVETFNDARAGGGCAWAEEAADLALGALMHADAWPWNRFTEIESEAGAVLARIASDARLTARGALRSHQLKVQALADAGVPDLAARLTFEARRELGVLERIAGAGNAPTRPGPALAQATAAAAKPTDLF